MLTLLTIAGCMGTLRSDEGADRVRSALWFSGNADGPTETLVLIANSALPCAPEDTTDDPETGLDEQAAALQYWNAQVASAFSREGAIVVMLGLYTWTPAVEGDYALTEEGLAQHLSLLEASPRVGFGAWLKVIESEVTETNGIFSNTTATEVDFDAAAASPSHATLDERDGERLSGEFALEPAGVAGSFHAEQCSNSDLYTAIFTEVVALQYAP
jgi:hypothetical protein